MSTHAGKDNPYIVGGTSGCFRFHNLRAAMLPAPGSVFRIFGWYILYMKKNKHILFFSSPENWSFWPLCEPEDALLLQYIQHPDRFAILESINGFFFFFLKKNNPEAGIIIHTVHAVIRKGNPGSSMLERSAFMRSSKYNLNGMIFSLLDVRASYRNQ